MMSAEVMADLLSEDELIARMQNQVSEAKQYFDDAQRLKRKSKKLQEDLGRDTSTAEDLKQDKNAKNKANSSAPDCFLTKAEIHSIPNENLQDKVVRMLKHIDEAKTELSSKHKEETTKLQEQMDLQTEQYETDMRLVEAQKDELVATLRRDIDSLQEEVARKNSIMVNLTQRVEDLTGDLMLLGAEHSSCEPKILSLEETIAQLRDELRIARTPKVPDLSLIIPAPCHRDSRLHNVLTQLMSRLELQHNVHIHAEVKDVADDDRNENGVVALPCIVSTNINSDLKAALKASELGRHTPSVLIMLHHAAPHTLATRLRVPSRKRLSSTAVTQRATLIADAVFWNEELYECDANTTMVEEIAQLARTGKTAAEEEELGQRQLLSSSGQDS